MLRKIVPLAIIVPAFIMMTGCGQEPLKEYQKEIQNLLGNLSDDQINEFLGKEFSTRLRN